MLENITVNGKSLKEVLYKPRTPRRGARTKYGKVIYTSDQQSQKVLISGMVFPWHEKAPYVNSGHSILGALELTEDESRVKCHECGLWFISVGSHIKNHGLTAKEYKTKHGFKLKSRLAKDPRKYNGFIIPKEINAVGRVKAMAVHKSKGSGYHLAGVLETANLRSQCQAQLSARILSIAQELGRAPTTKELANRGIHAATVRLRFGLKVNEVLKSLGLEIRKRGQYLPGPAHNKPDYWSAVSNQ